VVAATAVGAAIVVKLEIAAFATAATVLGHERALVM
jgi:hypothetical protein